MLTVISYQHDINVVCAIVDVVTINKVLQPVHGVCIIQVDVKDDSWAVHSNLRLHRCQDKENEGNDGFSWWSKHHYLDAQKRGSNLLSTNMNS